MKLHAQEPLLSTVFVDYDNIYLSLKRKNEEAAKRFAKDTATWLKEIETGRLITYTNGIGPAIPRRIVMTRCYGNPVPRRNSQDNATDMNSFPFVRHNFLRAGFEIIDCPPLTAQLKNSADIRMVMDILDYLGHETRFDEFVILSGDADFTPLLQRLRAHARRTIVFANEYTATPYTAISDGEVREADLISFLVEGQLPGQIEGESAVRPALGAPAQGDGIRQQILAEAAALVRAAGQPMPLEALAERLVRTFGHDKTAGTSWLGAGNFRDFLAGGLPEPLRVSDKPPFIVFDAGRRQLEGAPGGGAPAPEASWAAGGASDPPPSPAATPLQRAPAPPGRLREDAAAAIQQSIARIHEASKAPPLSPPEYRLLFNLMAQEINAHGLGGAQTITNILRRAKEEGTEFRRDDATFVLEVVSEPDPWFEQGASANLFAGRFRNFVVARCRSQGLSLSADELDLIEAWFAGPPPLARRPAAPVSGTAQPASAPAPASKPAAGSGGTGGAGSIRAAAPAPAPAPKKETSAEARPEPRTERWWSGAAGPAGDGEAEEALTSSAAGDGAGDEFPRILRGRLKN